MVQPHGKKVLTELDVVVFNTTQRIAVTLAGSRVAARGWPRWRRYLHHQPLAGVVPRHHPFRVTPWDVAKCRAPGNRRIVVELIVPNDVMKRSVIDLAKGSPDRIGVCVADAPGPFLECGGFIRCVDELLTESCVASIYLATKGTLSCRARTAIGEDRRIELEHEPPVDRVSSGEKWRRACGTWVGVGVGVASAKATATALEPRSPTAC